MKRKNMKRILAVILVLTMVLSMSGSVGMFSFAKEADPSGETTAATEPISVDPDDGDTKQETEGETTTQTEEPQADDTSQPTKTRGMSTLESEDWEPGDAATNATELQEMIDAADSGVATEISLDNPITMGSGIQLKIRNGKIIKLTGHSLTGSGNRVIDVENGGKLFLESIKITGGSAVEGGGVYVYGTGELTLLTGGEISGNTAASNGGGVYAIGTLTLAGGSISQNVVTHTGTPSGLGGGGVYSIGNIIIEAGTISGNDAKSGGGIYSLGNITIKGGSITNNTFTSTGGGIAIHSGNLTLVEGTISGNVGPGNGGGIYSLKGTVLMKNGTISGNSAVGCAGGGVYVQSEATGSFTMQGGLISGNKATRGAGVFNNIPASGVFTMTGGEICGNEAVWSGGGVFTAAIFTMKDGIISGNKVTTATNGEGGGVYNYGAGVAGVFTMEKGTISNNTSAGYGGGVSNYISTFIMKGGTISGNTAANGGGGVCNNSSEATGNKTFTIEGGTITENNANTGGGVCNTRLNAAGSLYPTIIMKGGTVSKNTATTNGGGIWHHGENEIAIQGGQITNNEAVNDGGGIWVDYNNKTKLATVDVAKEVVFSKNKARKATKIKPEDEPIHEDHILTKNFTSPFTWGYSNYDIAYDGPEPVFGPYTVKAKVSGVGGMAGPSDQEVNHGENAEEIVMKPAAGYVIDTVTLQRGDIDDVTITSEVSIDPGSGVGTYVITDVVSDCKLTVTFKEKANITIRYQSETGGFVDRDSESLAPATGIAQGSTAGENPGYNFVGWIDETGMMVCNEPTFVPAKVNGVNVAATYTALFTPRNYIVTATVGSAASTGTASPDSQVVTHGSNAEVITMIPAAGYEIDSVTLKQGGAAPIPITSDVTVNTSTGIGTYVIIAVANDYELTVTYKEKANITIHYQSEDTNRGTVDRASESLPPLTGNALGSTATAKPGYIVTHWTDSKGNTVRSAAAGATTDTFIPAKVGGLNVAETYTAHFTENTNVSIVYQSADLSMGTVSKDAENLAPATGTAEGSTAQPIPGYTFVNWTNEKGDVVSADPTFVPAKVDGLNVADTYTAHFKAEEFTVYFDYDGGKPDDVASMKVTYGERIMDQDQFPASITKAADKDFTYTFAGWEVIKPVKVTAAGKTQTAANNKAGMKSLVPGELLEPTDAMPANDVYLMAKWNAKKKDLAGPKLSVVKKADKTTVQPGGKLCYTITVTNKGSVDAKDIVIKDYLPKYTTYDSSTPNGTLSKENGKECVTWTLSSLKAGKSFEISLTVQIDKDIPKGHTIKNTVSYTEGEGEDTVTGVSNTAAVNYGKGPQTGDLVNMSLLVWIMAIAALTGVVIFLPSLRKRHKKNA